MPFPDGTGMAGGPTIEDTYTALGAALGGGAATEVGPEIVGSGDGEAPPAIPAEPGESMWPQGLQAPQELTLMTRGDGNAGASARPSGTGSAAIEAGLRAQIAQAGGAPEPEAEPERAHLALLYGTGVPLSLSAVAAPAGTGDDLTWKVACKTGTLALSPGPGQVDLEVPLNLTVEAFNDMVDAFERKAFPYVTVPKTHANGALENTGYVLAVENLSKAELMADARVSPEGKAHVQGDPEDTHYLLTGIRFTDPEAREKAANGSIPDTSVGVKQGYRNKRTGDTFRHALEHLALTPVPWVDGLIPFQPAMALGVQPFDQEEQATEFDGVFTEPPRQGLDLATRVEVSGEHFDAAATKAALQALGPGDELSWNWEVRVEKLIGQDDAGQYYLVRAPETAEPGDDWERKPRLYSDLDGAMVAISRGVEVCRQRREAERRRHAASGGPVRAVGYAQESGEGLNLAITFDPKKHPRDFRGRFKEKLDALKPGESIKLPDGVEVKRGKDPRAERLGAKPGLMVTRPDESGPGKHTSHSDTESAAKAALRASTSAGGRHELPDSLDDAGSVRDQPENQIARLQKRLFGMPQGNANRTPEQRKEAIKIRKEIKELREQLKDHKLSAVTHEDTLPRSGSTGSLERVNNGDHGMTIEEILAQQTAEIERLSALVEAGAARETNLSSRLTSQGEVLHADGVARQIRALNGKFPPSVLLAAQQVLLEDKPWEREDEGFNLSVQAPKTDEPGAFEARELKTPSDIVRFMLSAMPTGDASAATQLAAISSGLDEFNLAAHAGANKDADPVAEAKAKVDEWERKTHPERFDGEGKRLAA